jgi:hypothetical protein
MMRDKVISMQQMVPVYFQTSRWLRGYLDPPVYETGYNAPRAVTYANQLLGTLQNPVSPAVRKSGVSDIPFRDFNYIQPGWTQPQGSLLQAPCGFPGPRGDMAGQNNGRTDYAIWQHAFSQLFVNDADFKRVAQYPLFSIIDTNSAHHLSAPLVERAVKRTDATRLAGNPTRAMLVVNFDNHPDYGGDTTSPSTCQNWGCFVSKTVPNVYAYPIADAYVRFGANDPQANPTWSRGQWHQASSGGGMVDIDSTHAATLQQQLDTVIRTISPGGAANLDAYVSLDRDVLKRNFTQYNDGPFPAADGIAGVEACLAHLVHTGVRIVGFDICGLPTFPGATKDAVDFKVPDAMALAKTQVTGLWNYIVAL